MTPAAIPPNRKHLAAMLRLFARSGAYFGVPARRDLIEYLQIAEDTIEQQAIMLRADLTELTSHRQGRADDAQANGELAREIKRLKAENASLHQLVEAALDAGQQDDGEAIGIIRAALEGTP